MHPTVEPDNLVLHIFFPYSEEMLKVIVFIKKPHNMLQTSQKTGGTALTEAQKVAELSLLVGSKLSN